MLYRIKSAVFKNKIFAIMKKLFLISTICLMAIVAQAQNDSVTISGKVTDFDGTPIDSCTVCWMNESFETITQALTNSEGYYSAKIRKGNYNAVAAIYEPSYAHNALNTGLPENQHRLVGISLLTVTPFSISVIIEWRHTVFTRSIFQVQYRPFKYMFDL